MAKALLGIIGGSGIYDLPGLTQVHERSVGIALGRAV